VLNIGLTSASAVCPDLGGWKPSSLAYLAWVFLDPPFISESDPPCGDLCIFPDTEVLLIHVY
jgi:hypothetical protein